MKEKTDKPFTEWKFARKRDEWMRRLSMVPQKTMPSGAKLVAFRVALYMQEKKRRAFPTYEALGKACGMSARMVQEHTMVLGDWLEIERRRNKGNTYWLKYPFAPNGIVVPLETEAEREDSGNVIPME